MLSIGLAAAAPGIGGVGANRGCHRRRFWPHLCFAHRLVPSATVSTFVSSPLLTHISPPNSSSVTKTAHKRCRAGVAKPTAICSKPFKQRFWDDCLMSLYASALPIYPRCWSRLGWIWRPTFTIQRTRAKKQYIRSLLKQHCQTFALRPGGWKSFPNPER
jgi:hypothetical protein